MKKMYEMLSQHLIISCDLHMNVLNKAQHFILFIFHMPYC